MSKQIFSFVSILAIVLLVLGPQGNTSAAAQTVPAAPIRLVRTLEADETGVGQPVGITFSQLGSRFHLVGAYQPGQRLPAFMDVQQLDRFADPSGSTLLQASVGDPMNITFDNLAGRLLVYQSSSASLLAVKQDAVGNLLSTSQTAYDFRRFGLQSVQGLSFDEGSGSLYILDSAAQRILRIKPDSSGSFASAQASSVDLSALRAIDLHGLAVDPASGNLFVTDPAELQLYELTPNGDLVSQRDLSALGVQNPQGMTFAPSGDQTDDPSEMSLYLADSGDAEIVSSGGVYELSLLEAPGIQEFAFTATLVAERNLALISPPSPDATGIAYHSGTGHLLVSDSEVEEAASSAYWQNTNVWELALDASAVYATGNTSTTPVVVLPFSNEPTGIAYNPDNGHYYFSDDNTDRVYDLGPGTDAQMLTGDDIVTSFLVVAENGDPEGVAFGNNTIFIADGINSEIYMYSTGGTYQGQFDTAAFGVLNPNTVEYNPQSNSLFILSNSGQEVIAETTPAGLLLRTIDVSAIPVQSPDGLAYAPSTNADPLYHFYIADRGIDNDTNPVPDAKIWEITAPEPVGDNLPPIVNAGLDQIITIPPGTTTLTATMTDDGKPVPATVTWSKVSGACVVSLSAPTSLITNATFPQAGRYELRIDATDTQLNSWDTLIVDVKRPPSTAIFDAYIEHIWDDAEQDLSDGSVKREGTAIDLGEHPSLGAQVDGFRFNWLDIPKGAIITNAYIQFTANGASSGPAALTIKGQAADNSATFLNVPNDISNRATTAASVAWSPADWAAGEAGVAQRTPDLSPILQELVNRAGWVSGNSAAFIISGTGTRIANGYEANPCSTYLHVEWTLPVTAVDDTYGTPEDTQLVVPASGVLGNDLNPGAYPLTAVLVSGPINGTLTLNPDGSFTYTPNLNYNGPDTFTYKVNNGAIDSNVATVTINISPVNDAPMAVDQPVTTNEDTSVPIVLGATDVDLDPLTYTILTNPTKGSLSGTPPNLTYTPTLNLNGADSFTFKVNDGQADSNIATVSITITPVNDLPAPIPQSVTTDEDTPVGITLTATDAESDPITLALTSLPTHGSLSGTVPNMVYTPEANYAGSDSFTFTASDLQGTSTPATVSITINAVNDTPVVTGIPDQTIAEGASFTTINLDNYVTDVDNDKNQLTWTYSGNVDLTLTITNRVATIGIPSMDWNGTETITFRATDPGLLYGEDSAIFTVTNVNDPPVAVDDEVSVPKNSVDNIINVLSNDSDIDEDTLSVSAVGTASHGTVTFAAGVVKYTPNTGFVGIDSFTYTVSDGSLSDIGAVTITVGANHPPVAVADSFMVLINRTLVVLPADGVLKNDTDEDGHALTAILVSAPGHHDGVFTLNPDGSFTYTPAAGFFGTDTFTYKANDGLADSNVVTVTISVRLPLFLPAILK